MQKDFKYFKENNYIPDYENFSKVKYSWRPNEALCPLLEVGQTITEKEIAIIDNWLLDIENEESVSIGNPTKRNISDALANKMLQDHLQSHELSKAVSEFEKALSKAEKIADKYNLSFNIDPAYGMGGYYEDGEWHPSSQNC